MTPKFVLYANQKSCFIVIPSLGDFGRTPGCYRGGAPRRDQLNNGFERGLAPVVRKLDNAIHRINRYPADKC